jgi:hypothetical protein
MGGACVDEGSALAAGLARFIALRRFAGFLDFGLALPITHHSSLITSLA